MKILQHNLNHCEAAHDLLTQTVRDRQIDLVIIVYPYTRLNTQAWVTFATGITTIWSCKNRPFENQVDITQKGFVRVKLVNLHFYSVYAPPSLTINEFKNLLDRLAMDARKHSPRVLAGDFNAWAAEWGSKKTDARGNEAPTSNVLLRYGSSKHWDVADVPEGR